MKKRLIASAVAMSVLLCATACAEDTTTNETATTTTTTTVVNSTVDDSASDDNTTPAESEITAPALEFSLESIPTIEVTSSKLNDGVWDDVISNTSHGENQSPDLSWDAVDGAGIYVLYMVDTTAVNWMHMKATVTTNSVEAGSLGSQEYIGPYPPPDSGDHNYVVYVFALRSAPERVKGVFDTSNSNFNDFIASLDLNDAGESGNMLSYGKIEGTYSAS